MKARLLAVSALSAVALVGTAYADGAEASKSHWSGSVSLTSDYRFRGISQTDRNPAVQGGVQYNGSQGIYVGAWASNVDWSGAQGSEIDLSAGYNVEVLENTTVGAGVVYYWYPNADNSDLDYVEFIGRIAHSMGNIGASLEVAYSPDFAGDTTLAFTGGVDAKLIDSVYLFNDGISASGHFGRQTNDGLPADYNFYDIGMTATAGSFALDVRYAGSDLNKVECGGTDRCESGLVVTGTISFGG